jgi:hypothetical protein
MVRTRDVTYERDAEAVNLVGHVIWVATTSYLLGTARKCLTPSSGVRIVGDTKWISAIRQFALKSTPANRRSKYSSRQTLRRMRKSGGALQSSTFPATCLVKLLALLLDAQQLREIETIGCDAVLEQHD